MLLSWVFLGLSIFAVIKSLSSLSVSLLRAFSAMSSYWSRQHGLIQWVCRLQNPYYWWVDFAAVGTGQCTKRNVCAVTPKKDQFPTLFLHISCQQDATEETSVRCQPRWPSQEKKDHRKRRCGWWYTGHREFSFVYFHATRKEWVLLGTCDANNSSGWYGVIVITSQFMIHSFVAIALIILK